MLSMPTPRWPIMKKTSNGSVDTNILLRLVVGDVSSQFTTAKKLIENGTYHVADIAIIEVIFALDRYYNVPRQQIAEVVFALAARPNLVLNRALFMAAIPNYIKHPRLSIEDCCLAEYARLNSALPLWTFDKKLAGQVVGCKELAA